MRPEIFPLAASRRWSQGSVDPCRHVIDRSLELLLRTRCTGALGRHRIETVDCMLQHRLLALRQAWAPRCGVTRLRRTCKTGGMTYRAGSIEHVSTAASTRSHGWSGGFGRSRLGRCRRDIHFDNDCVTRSGGFNHRWFGYGFRRCRYGWRRLHRARLAFDADCTDRLDALDDAPFAIVGSEAGHCTGNDEHAEGGNAELALG